MEINATWNRVDLNFIFFSPPSEGATRVAIFGRFPRSLNLDFSLSNSCPPVPIFMVIFVHEKRNVDFLREIGKIDRHQKVWKSLLLIEFKVEPGEQSSFSSRFKILFTHHVDYVMKRKAKDDRQGLGGILGWTYTGVVSIEQIFRQSIFVFIPKTWKSKYARNSTESDIQEELNFGKLLRWIFFLSRARNLFFYKKM